MIIQDQSDLLNRNPAALTSNAGVHLVRPSTGWVIVDADTFEGIDFEPGRRWQGKYTAGWHPAAPAWGQQGYRK